MSQEPHEELKKLLGEMKAAGTTSPSDGDAYIEVFHMVDPDTASVETLDLAIASHEEQLEARPDSPTRALHKVQLARLLAGRSEKTGSREKMERAIALQREAVAEIDAPDLRGTALYNLGVFLSTSADYRSQRESADAYREAFPLLTGGHRLGCVTNMVQVLLKLSALEDDPEVADEAVRFALEALADASSDSRSENGIWETLLAAVTHRLLPPETLSTLVQEARALTDAPAKKEMRAARFDRLGRLLRAEWNATFDVGPLSQAVEAGRKAVALLPDHYGMAANLSASLRDAGNVARDPELLEDALRHLRAALARTPPGTHDHLSLRGDLGAALNSLGALRRDEKLLREAVEHTQSLIDHASQESDTGTLSIYLPNLAGQKLLLAQLTGSHGLMGEALAAHRQALGFSYPAARRAVMLTNYASALREHAKGTDRPADDLRNAERALAEAVVMCPDLFPELEDVLTLYAVVTLELVFHDRSTATLDTVVDAWERTLVRAYSLSFIGPTVICLNGLTNA
ncbi:hypothetical protein [Streptomyces cyslabdanicus]|uniref:hypothetical protein n=1 Tax=Streptomyces cyslabdanicus TaxID=1470456 RepID=UPI004044B712